VRRLALDLALLPVEGGARVAILERADRLGDDAQTALLKTLEEPPAGVTIVLCADDEDRLMPTVRSRCARIRLGPVGVREIEALLGEADLADAPTAARLARLAGGRPGLARSLALAPDAIAARDQIARTLLHLLDAGPSSRLAASRELIELATAMDRTLDRSAAEAAGSTTEPSSGGRSGRGRSGSKRATRPGAGMAAGAEPPDDGQDDATDGDGDGPAAPAASASAAQRRRAAASIVGLWRDLARDLVVAGLGVEREVRDPGLLDDLRDAATLLGAGPHAAQDAGDRAPDPVAARLTAFLGRLDAAGELLEANVRPELVLDTLLLAWPSATAARPSRAERP